MKAGNLFVAKTNLVFNKVFVDRGDVAICVSEQNFRHYTKITFLSNRGVWDYDIDHANCKDSDMISSVAYCISAWFREIK